MSQPPALSASNIDFRYTPTAAPALSGLTLDLPAARITAILGPNGSGKSTLLHVLLGWLIPQAGAVVVEQQPLGARTRRELSRIIGLVPQQEHIPFDFSVLDFVLLGRAPYLGALDLPGEEDVRCALDALSAAGMDAMKDRAVTRLSGGEVQLAMIARALAQRPRILLLDEPTSHLDLGHRRAAHRVMRKLVQGGVTVVFTTHDPNLAALADHAVLLRGGRLLAAGPVADVLTSGQLTETYGVPVDVLTAGDRRVILS